MIVGLGVDVCSIERMKKALERHGDRFAKRICTDDELGELRGDRATALAGRFAVKEAFAKALDGARGVGWHEVEVRREASGKPVLRLRGNALAMATSFGADTWHVTISHDANVAVAVVVLEKDGRGAGRALAPPGGTASPRESDRESDGGTQRGMAATLGEMAERASVEPGSAAEPPEQGEAGEREDPRGGERP